MRSWHYWKGWYLVVSLCLFVGVLVTNYVRRPGGAAYPSGPITLVVHSKPGSGIDLMARAVADIAQKRHNVTMVVENRTGTQGVVAMDYVLGRKSDGYTVLAVTKSFLSTLMVQKSKIRVDDFSFVANMMQDPEAIISNAKSKLLSIDDLISDARARPGKQAWIGPGTGGRDQLMALKTWATLGIEAQWIDYKSAPQAALAMLRGEGDVTVGNPGDVEGKPDLALIAVAHPSRLVKFPDVPTFKELGFDLNEYMWRGFALKRGVPEKRVAFLEDLFAKIASDEEFRNFVSEQAAFVDFKGRAEFSRQVDDEVDETQSLLAKGGLLENYISEGRYPGVVVYLLFLVVIALGLLAVSELMRVRLSEGALIGGVLLWLCSVFWYQTTLFRVPEKLNITSPALIPRLWITLLSAFSVALIAREFKRNSHGTTSDSNGNESRWVELKRLAPVVCLTGSYYFLVPSIGFSLATFLFLLAMVRLVYTRDVRVGLALASSFVVGCYFVFNVVLSVELPAGIFG